MDSEVDLSIGTAGSNTGEGLGGVDGFDFDLPTRNKSKNGVEAFLAAVGEEEAKSSGEGFECAGGRK